MGSLRRERLDHVIVWNERSLRRHLQQCLAYDHNWRTHLALAKDAPVPRGRCSQPAAPQSSNSPTSADDTPTTNVVPLECHSARPSAD